MYSMWSAGLVAGATLLLGGQALAQSADATSEIEALRNTVRTLNERLANLENGASEQWLTEERAAQIRGVVHDVLADAETRSSFQDTGATAGYNRGFFISSPDGNFSLRVSAQLQIRYILNDAKEQPSAYGFQMRRTKLAFEGNFIDKTWRYKVQGAFGRANGNFTLEEAYVDKNFGDGLSVRVGQYKAPWLQEQLVSSRRQLAVERSLLDGYFSQGYDRGIQLQYQTDDFRVRLWTGNGIQTPFRGGSQNVTTSNWNTNPTNYSFVGRGEYKLGEAGWSDFSDFNSFRGNKFGAMVGVSGMIQRYNDNLGGAGANATSVSGITADATVNFGGASLFGYFVYQTGTNVEQTDGTVGNATPWGFLVQGGYFVTDDIEVFGRYEYGNLSQNRLSDNNNNDLNMITVGANYFIAKNNLKFTVDFGINLNSLGRATYSNGFGNNDGAGYRRDVNNEQYQWALRAQVQLAF
jgi:hypothetical protein